MKKIFGFWNLMLLVTGSLFIVSCGEEGDPIDGTSPTVTQSHTFDETKGQDPSTPVVFTIKGVKGASELRSITVQENNVELTTDRFKVDGVIPASSTILLLGADKQGFSKEFSINLPANTNTYTYKFTITDESNKTDVVTVDVKVEGLTTITSEKMYNYLGPATRPGGMDLSTGKAVFKGPDPDEAKGWPGADIRDDGNNLVGEKKPWKGSFIPWGGSTVRKINNSASFETTISKAQIVELFNNGSSDLTIAKMIKGDVYVVKNGSDYYLVKIKEVVDDGKDEGTDINSDYSEFEIKL